MPEYSPIPELNSLKALQDELGFENYAEGFGLTDFGDTSAIATGWCGDPEFVGRLVPFAQANCSGSIYALWRVDDRPVDANVPVAVFGDEGGQHVIARNLLDLFQLLTFDSEIKVDWDTVYFYRSPGEPYRAGHDRYVAWLADSFGLSTVDDTEPVMRAAEVAYGEAFEAWAGRFLD